MNKRQLIKNAVPLCGAGVSLAPRAPLGGPAPPARHAQAFGLA